MAPDATKARLLEAAGEEFAEKGFDGATVRAIIERARANVAAVNYHFGDKERLYVQAVIEAHRCGLDEELEDDPDGTAPERLRAFVHHFLSRVLAIQGRDSWHHKLMVREMVRPSPASEALVREVIRPKFEGLRAILGEACPEADERRLTAVAFSVIGQCLHYKMARPIAEKLIGLEALGRLDLEYLTDHITAFSLAAIGLGPPVAGACPEHAASGEGGPR